MTDHMKAASARSVMRRPTMTNHQQAAIEAAMKKLLPRFLGQSRTRCEDSVIQALAEILGKGSEITVTGTLAMEIYETSNGRGSKLVVRFPRFKGLVPKRQNPSQAPQGGVLRAEHTEPGWVHYPAHDRAPGWRAGPSRESWTARTLGTARPPKF